MARGSDGGDAGFEARMRTREWFHGIKLVPGAWTVLRVDGHGFSRLTDHAGYDRPFDEKFRDRMIATARALLEEMQGVYAYIESDEVSVLLDPRWEQFDRSLEKSISLSAGLASATFTATDPAVPGHFDSRAWVGTDIESVSDYFRWRQADSSRCCLNGWCYWTLRREGMTSTEATAALDGRGFAFKNELLFQRGQNFDKLPAWQRRGIGLAWESYTRDAVDPRTGTPVQARRRRIGVNLELPMKAGFGDWIAALCRSVSGS